MHSFNCNVKRFWRFREENVWKQVRGTWVKTTLFTTLSGVERNEKTQNIGVVVPMFLQNDSGPLFSKGIMNVLSAMPDGIHREGFYARQDCGQRIEVQMTGSVDKIIKESLKELVVIRKKLATLSSEFRNAESKAQSGRFSILMPLPLLKAFPGRSHSRQKTWDHAPTCNQTSPLRTRSQLKRPAGFPWRVMMISSFFPPYPSTLKGGPSLPTAQSFSFLLSHFFQPLSGLDFGIIAKTSTVASTTS